MSVFGSIMTAQDVEEAAMATLQKWSGAYLAEIERLNSKVPGDLPRIRSWTTVNEFGHWPEEQLPACLLVSPGLAEPPSKRSGGRFWATWTLGVAVIVSGRNRANTKELSHLYTAAIRTLLVQQPSLDGASEGITWLDERYNDIPELSQRTLGAGQSTYLVTFRDVADSSEGPLTPADVGPRPIASSATITVQPKED